MFTKRHTAYYVRIKDLLEGNTVSDNNSTSVLVRDIPVFRVQIVATVVKKYISEDRNYCFLTIDDNSETISLKLFDQETEMAEGIEVGDLIRIVARIRVYNDEKYLQPSIIRKIHNPNWMLHWRTNLYKGFKDANKKISPSQTLEIEEENVIEEVIETPRVIIMKKIKEQEKGISVDEIVKETPFNAETVNNVVNDLLRDGDIFEPKPGIFKVI